MEKIEIPFGASDSEAYYEEIVIPEGFEAIIQDGKIILRRKESKDEKIRKNCIHFLELQKKYHASTVEIDECITWLEKQEGNNNQNWKPSKEQIIALEHFVRSIGESGYASPYDGNTNLLYSLINDLYELEKQGVQKPANKVEPKLHEGDWVVTCANSVVQIKAINSNNYVLENTMRFNIAYVDKYWHIWTIADAKDGDVLTASDGSIFIYAGCDDVDCKYHIALAINGSIHVSEGTELWEETSSVKPATKEQRDLLFQKMKDNNWEWDAKAKKLNKKLKTFPTLSNSSKVGKNETKWTDEDFRAIDNCCLLIAADNSYEKAFKDDCIHYLQNLKKEITHDNKR